MYRGYKIKWTGWKPNNCSVDCCGQWVAGKNVGDPKPSTLFVANSGGVACRYNRGDYFDISVLHPEDSADSYSTPEQLSAIRKRTLDRLIQLLRKEGF
jgi:hypothetical protein